MTDTPISREQAMKSLDGLLSHWTQEGRDTVHQLISALPPLNSLREPRPNAELHCHSCGHLANGHQLTPVPGEWACYEDSMCGCALSPFDISATALATSPPIQGEPCPTNHKAPNGESWSEIEWFICVGGEDYEKWTSATSNRVYDHCPDCGQPLSSPQGET